MQSPAHQSPIRSGGQKASAHNLFKEKKALGAGIGVVLGAIIMVIGYTLYGETN